MKFDDGKPDYTLVPMEIVDAIEKVREYGVDKYSDPLNWMTVSKQRYWRAILRHTRAAWEDMDKVDPESGLPHIWHIACNLAFIIALEEKNKCKTNVASVDAMSSLEHSGCVAHESSVTE